MANEMNLDFELWLKSKFDGDALNAAQAEFRRTQKAADDVKDGISGIGGSLKSALGELIAVAAVLTELKEGFQEVTAQEQAFNRLSDAAARFGGNTGELNEKFQKLATTIQEKSGLDDDALYKAMVKVYQATGDMNEAMGQAALAADVARGANVPLEQALSLVNATALGNTRSLRELGISVETTGDKAKDARTGLDALQKSFGGSAASAKGTTVELGKLKEEWGNVRNDFIAGSGEMLGGVLKFINLGLQPLFTSLQLAGNSIKTIIASVREFGGVIGSIIAGDWKGAKEGLAKTKDTLVDGFENAFEIIKARAQKMWATINGETGGGIEAPKAKGTGVGGGSGGKGDKPDGYDPVVALENFRQEQLRKIREKMDDERIKSEEMLQKNLERLRAHGQKDAIRIERELDAERERLKDNQTQRILEEVRIRRQAEEAKREAGMATASALIGAMGTIFGESKALASADALISTWAGAARALKDWPAPYSYVIAAATIAAGLARVAQINSTEPTTQGGGFDNPSNDRAAYLGGRRWAADMIGEFTKGVSSGWSAGMGATTNNTTNDNRRTFNVHMHGAGLIDPTNLQMVKQLKRTLDRVDVEIEGQRTIARAR